MKARARAPQTPKKPPPVSPCNCFIAPGYDPRKLVRALKLQLDGDGGMIDQKLLYIDTYSAYDWVDVASHREYQATKEGYPYDLLAQEISWCFSQNPGQDEALQIIALGPGDAHKETQLVLALLENRPILKQIRLTLLDIS